MLPLGALARVHVWMCTHTCIKTGQATGNPNPLNRRQRPFRLQRASGMMMMLPEPPVDRSACLGR